MFGVIFLFVFCSLLFEGRDGILIIFTSLQRTSIDLNKQLIKKLLLNGTEINLIELTVHLIAKETKSHCKDLHSYPFFNCFCFCYFPFFPLSQTLLPFLFVMSHNRTNSSHNRTNSSNLFSSSNLLVAPVFLLPCALARIVSCCVADQWLISFLSGIKKPLIASCNTTGIILTPTHHNEQEAH